MRHLRLLVAKVVETKDLPKLPMNLKQSSFNRVPNGPRVPCTRPDGHAVKRTGVMKFIPDMRHRRGIPVLLTSFATPEVSD